MKKRSTSRQGKLYRRAKLKMSYAQKYASESDNAESPILKEHYAKNAIKHLTESMTESASSGLFGEENMMLI